MKQEKTFDCCEFERLKKAEAEHFFFHIRRKWIRDRIRRFIPPPAHVLEVGCGTGCVSNFLSQEGYVVTGCECHLQGLDLAWPGFLKVQGDANRLPFKCKSMDVVGFFDVIEHFQDEVALLKEANRVIKERGIVVITVPARKELWSRFDEHCFHKRRYTKEKLESVLLEARLIPLLTEYMFMSLYPPMKYIRGKGSNVHDPYVIDTLLNAVAKGLFEIERCISTFMPLPLGTSLITVAKKM